MRPWAKLSREGIPALLNEKRSVESAVKPGSVVDSHSSRPAIAHWLKQPTRVRYGPYHVNPYLALLRVEFTVPRTVASRAVRSYRTLSPLPDPACTGHRRFALCCTCRELALPRRYLAPCPMEPGLSSPSPVSPKGRRRSGDCLGRLRRGVYMGKARYASGERRYDAFFIPLPDTPAHSDTARFSSRRGFPPPAPLPFSTAAPFAAAPKCAGPPAVKRHRHRSYILQR